MKTKKQKKANIMKENIDQMIVDDASTEFEKYSTTQWKKSKTKTVKTSLTNSQNSTTNWPLLAGRPVSMTPEENYHLLLRTVYYPNKLMKLFTKFGVNMNWTETLNPIINKTKHFLRYISKL
jgi:hypothetical protein